VQGMQEWLGIDPDSLTDEELAERTREFQAARARFDAAELATLAAWDRRQVWANDGALTGGAWLAGHLGVASSTARERLRVARSLATMPLTGAAFEAGEISYAKVRLLARHNRDRTEPAFQRDEAMLVDFARRLSTDDLERALAYWKSHADPDGASKDQAEQWDRRGASTTQIADGDGFLHARFDPESFAFFTHELEALADEAYEQDRNDHKIDPTLTPRTRSQRLLDALTEMARRSAACDLSTTKRGRTEAIITLEYDDLIATTGGSGELASGGRLSGDAARRLACDANIIRAVVAGRSELLDLGRATPNPNTAQRRAAEQLWSSCVFIGCDRPITWSDLHHVIPYRRGQPVGGTTDHKKLAPACSGHHPLFHEGGWSIAHDIDTDEYHLIRPDGTTLATVQPDGPITRRKTLLTV